MRFAVLGSAHLSLISRVQGYSGVIDRPGELEFSYGGSGFCLAKNLARLGASVSFGTILADTTISRMIVGDLEREGVDVQAEFRKGLPEAGYSAHIAQSGDILSAVSSTPVSSAPFRRDFLSRMIGSADAVLLDCNLSTDTLLQSVQIANTAKKLVFIAAVSETKSLKILEILAGGCKIDGLFANESELSALLSAASATERVSGVGRRFGQRVTSRGPGVGMEPSELANRAGGAICETRGVGGVAVWDSSSLNPIAEYNGPTKVPAGAAGGSIWQGAGDQLMAMSLFLYCTDHITLGGAVCWASRLISESPTTFLAKEGGNPLEAKISALRDEALIDPLTRLANRRGLKEWMDEKPTDFDLAFLLLDVDHFKRVNDEFGHQVGDVVLREIGGIVAGSLRDSDFGCRWGGEEMAVVLPRTDLTGALEVAERLRQSIAGHGFGHGPVTCSIGVAIGAAGALDKIFEEADAALYAAKRSGRNRVMSGAATPNQISA